MILPGGNINAFDITNASNTSFFTGGLNLQALNFDPLVTGYAFIKWIHLPEWITNTFPGFQAMTEKNFKALEGISDIELNTETYQYGFNNNEYHVPTSSQKGNTEITLKHQEYSGNLIKNSYSFWVNGISDPEIGIATYPAMFDIDYAAKNHTASLAYIVTRPDANNINHNNIEFSAIWTNLFPTKLPIGHYNYTQGTHDLVEIEIPFKGTMHIGPKVDNYCKELLGSCYAMVSESMFDPTNGGNYGLDDLSASASEFPYDTWINAGGQTGVGNSSTTL